MDSTSVSHVSRPHRSSTREINPTALNQSQISYPCAAYDPSQIIINTDTFLYLTLHLNQANMSQSLTYEEVFDALTNPDAMEQPIDPRATNRSGNTDGFPNQTNNIDELVDNMADIDRFANEMGNDGFPNQMGIGGFPSETSNFDVSPNGWDYPDYSGLLDGDDASLYDVPEEVSMISHGNGLELVTNGLRTSRENYTQQTYFPQETFHQNYFHNAPVSPTSTEYSCDTSIVFTPSSSPSSPNKDLPQHSTTNESWIQAFGDWDPLKMGDPLLPTTPSTVQEAPLQESLLPASPIAFTPTSSQHTPLTPLTPDPSPIFVDEGILLTPPPPPPATDAQPVLPAPPPPPPPSSRNGRGSVSKPTKRRRRASNSGITKTLRCDFAGNADSAPCNKEFDRQCDLKKHKKRHSKDFPCRYPGCTNNRGAPSEFSSEKDRERHENCLHKKECLICTECGHETPRKDNMRDHVIRKHGKQHVDVIMQHIMAAPRTSPRPDDDEDEMDQEEA